MKLSLALSTMPGVWKCSVNGDYYRLLVRAELIWLQATVINSV